MASVYPGSIPSYAPHAALMSDPPLHDDVEVQQEEDIVAVATELGVAPSGSFATVKARLDTFDTAHKAWSASFGGAVTLGNGTFVARYTQLGPLILAQCKLLFGSTTTVNAALTLTTPVNIFDGNFAVGNCLYIDDSAGAAGRFSGTTRPVSAATVALMTGHQPGQNITATVPFTWAASDVLAATLVYLAA